MKLTIMVVLFAVTLSAKTIKMDQTVVVARDGVARDNSSINYIILSDSKTGKPSILLTVVCEQHYIWQHLCFPLNKGDRYVGHFEYNTSAHKHDFVTITGHPGGNLTDPVTMKSKIVNFQDVSEGK